jgi:uncharacterized protein (TIGR02453 family)
MLKPSTLKFIKDLDKHNNKTWFDANRKKYEDAKFDFENFVQRIIDKHGKKDPDIASLKAKETTFRINRDVRFSKDKRPYKDNMGSYMAKGGKKSIYAGYYINIRPGNYFSGGGLWMPQPPELQKVRQEIDYNLDEFKEIVEGKKFRNVFGKLSMDKEFTLTRVPKGFEADNPAAEYLKFKSYVATSPLTEADLTSKEGEKKILKAFEALQPLLVFLNRSME